MSPPQESRYGKINAIAAVVALILGYLAWQYPMQSRSNPAGPPETSEVHQGTDFANRNGTPTPPPPASNYSGTDSDSNHDAASGGSAKPEDEGKGKGDEPGSSPSFRRSMQACGVPEIATLRPGAPAKVASGLAILSVKAAREGSEPYLTLGIASDRDTVAEAVLGAPMRYRFATSRGTYFVDVIDIDLAAGSMTVQVGCPAKENTP
jgi:hypothetical protein